MAIPVYLQQFKAAGIYRLVFDKSTVLNVNSEILRLVVGYSEQGPFNIPTYVKNASQFKTLYGDISTKLEKRGVWFHRLAQQALATGPILALNLKKFDGEKVGAATIDTTFSPKFNAIDSEELYLEDIYNTTRFWELDAEKIIGARTVDGSKMDKYINICTTDTASNSATYFIRKAVGSVINNFKVSLNDWYADGTEPMPEYLESAKNTLVSDYMAEIYVFKGKFTKEQVLASTSLKNHFTTDDNGELVLRKYELDAFGEPVDSLNALYNDENAGALGHYVGTLIPTMKNKKGQYISLDIVFNDDQDVHKMMMSFNTDMLEDDEPVDIAIAGKNNISDSLISDICDGSAVVSVLGNNQVEVVADSIKYSNNVADSLSKEMPFAGRATSISGCMFVKEIRPEYDNAGNATGAGEIVFGNIGANGVDKNEVVVYCDTDFKTVLNTLKNKKVYGADAKESDEYKKDWAGNEPAEYLGKTVITSIKKVKLEVHGDDSYYRVVAGAQLQVSTVNIETTLSTSTTYGHKKHTHIYNASLTYAKINDNWYTDDELNKTRYISINGDNTLTSVFSEGDTLIADSKNVNGYHNQAFITKIETIPASSDAYFAEDKYADPTSQIITAQQHEKLAVDRVALFNSLIEADAKAEFNGMNKEEANEIVKSLIDDEEFELAAWLKNYVNDFVTEKTGNVLNTAKMYDEDLDNLVALYKLLQSNAVDMLIEECYLVEKDGKLVADTNYACEYYLAKSIYHNQEEYKTQETYFPVDYTYIEFTEKPYVHTDAPDDPSHNFRDESVDAFLVRIDNDICQENGLIYPQFLEGYTFYNAKPEGTDMKSKLDWQNNVMLAALTDYKGLRTGLLNKSDIDYRYVVDTFETYVTTGAKKVLSFLCKEKQSAFAIVNFPAVKTFVKCPYASYVNNKGVFDVQYVVDGYNKKKSHSMGFSLPSDDEGASFCAFYTPLKFSDGYVDNIVPSAALVSNLFMQKYLSRQPYYIIAGPNYGAISASGLVGPDYNYSMEELQIIEPYGVNCMVYRPNFGTFINANQTAKQTPVSALSKVNVRELVIYLQDEIEKVLQNYQWEFNNANTRNAILDKANSICANIQNNGGIQAYKNIMNETNNTPEIIDNEMAILSTHIEPGFGCGKMVQELTIYRTGQLSSSISE